MPSRSQNFTLRTSVRPHADFDIRARIILLSGLLIIDGTLGSLLIYRSLNARSTRVHARMYIWLNACNIRIIATFLAMTPSQIPRETNGISFCPDSSKERKMTRNSMSYYDKPTPFLFSNSVITRLYYFLLASFVNFCNCLKYKNWKNLNWRNVLEINNLYNNITSSLYRHISLLLFRDI